MSTDTAARDTYLESVDARFAPLVRELDRAILAARPDLRVAVKYRILMYALEGDFRHWICAVDARPKTVCLRFLFGARLVAPRGTLRPGSTTMGTIDYTALEQVDAGLIADLVEQAVAHLRELRASGPGGRG
jgi:hypothetical protein